MSIDQSTLAAIAAIIESISGVSTNDLGADTDLLDLGLDSLMFVRIGRVLEGQYRVDISMKRFYDELSNLGALARFLSTHGTAPATSSPEPESHAQTRMVAPVADQTPPVSVDFPPAAGTSAANAANPDLNTVMAAHMALMRRYLDSVASGVAGVSPAPGQVVVASTSSHQDAVETRKKFSGIETEKQALSREQQNFIEQLAQRLSVRCRRSKEMADTGKEWLADWKYSLQFKQDLKELRFPIVCDTASGSRFVDVDGNEYVDIAMGMGVHYFGHSPRFIDDAVRAQLESNLALGPQSRIAPDVARRICAMTGHDRAAFFVTGSDAVMLALRLVRAARARDKVVMFAGAYHGICSDVLAAQGENGAVPMSPGLPTGLVNDLVVLDYDAPESLLHIREMADQLAGVLVEPVQSRNPALQPQRFLRQLRALCTELNIPLIFDEMVNGFRQAAGGMQEWFGVKADMSTYGKIIGGGYPLSVIAGNADLMQWIDGGVWRYGDDSAPLADSIATGGTHNKHPVALAAASAVLDHIESNPQLFAAARLRMHQLADRINVWFERNAVPLRLTYFGTQFKFESFASTLEQELFFYLLLENGVYTWELHVANLSTAHTQDDADHLFSAVVRAVESLRAGGFDFRAGKLRRQYVPMSSVQKRLYAVTRREGAEKPYHLAGAWRLSGTVDAARLEDCIHQVIIRHESLRSAFVVVDGEFYQRIVAEPRFFLDRLDAGSQSAEALLETYIQPFDMLEPPLLRAALAQTDDGSTLLLIDVHHIVADGLSMNVVLQEILALYDGNALGPVRAQARHVQDSITRYLASERAQDDARFWLDRLGPFTHTQDSFDLSPDFTRPAVTSFAGKRIAVILEQGTTAALHRFCATARLSTFSALFAVFVVWTWHYARQQRFVVGLPSSGRPDNDAAHAVGMFVNTLAFAVDMPSDMAAPGSVKTFLQQIRDQLFESQAHSDYPFGELIKDLKIGHRADRNPLFDVMFSYENAGSREIRTQAFTGETLTQYEGAGMFDISFDLIETESRVLINCAFAESQFSEATMLKRLNEYRKMLESLVAGTADTLVSWVQGAVETPVVANPLMAEKMQPISRSLSKKPEPPMTIAAWWQQQVSASADQVALIEDAHSLSYADLDLRVRNTAFALFNLYGVRPGDRVVVSLDSSTDLVVVMLALWSMGAVYVPVTPDTPVARLRTILQQCHATHLIFADDAQTDITFAVEGVAMKALGDYASGLGDYQSVPLPEAGDSAYVIFTSGSTGVPKGVEIVHAGIVNSVRWRIHAYELNARDTTLQMPSAAFDASIMDVLSALLSGGRLVMTDTASKRSVQQVRELITRHQVSAILLTPTLYRVFLDHIPEAMASLRFVTLAGEKLPLDLMQQHFALAPDTALWNEYGPTECSVVVTGGQLLPEQDRVTIGWPVSNTLVHILDDQGHLAPNGVWGRLWVSGVGLAKGYVNDEVSTRERFCTMPMLGDIRCYNTGDIARVLDNGALEFRERDDSQVKVNGYRIELQDVEAALRSTLGIKETAANVISKGTSASLHAWIVADIEPPRWRELMMQVLPVWMVPIALHRVPELPLLSSGKLDRKALLPSDGELASLEVIPSPANDVVTALLLEHCRVILGRPTLAPEDHYFNAGGDSIQAIVLASRLTEAGYSLDINDLFRYPVLSRLAECITPIGKQPLQSLPDSSVILPTPMQRWFGQICPDKHLQNTFTQGVWLRLPADISLSQLRDLCQHWVAQHAVFQDSCAQPCETQSVERLVDCTEIESTSDIDAVVQEAQAGIQLQQGPLLRVVLLKTGNGSKALVICHHFVIDAVSWQILQTQWAALWQDIKADKPLRAFAETATMRQFAKALHSDEARQMAQRELPFWQAMLAGNESVCTAPVAAADTSGAQRAVHTLDMDAGIAEALLTLGHPVFRSRGGDLLLSAFATALASVCEQKAVSILMESNGRAQRYAQADFSTTVGWMTSAFPIRIDCAGIREASDWPSRVERIRDVVHRVPEQGVGFGVLRHLLKDASLAAVEPEIAFNYLGRFQHQPDQDFAIIEQASTEAGVMQQRWLPPLECVCYADEAGLHVSISADTTRTGVDLPARLIAAFREQLNDLALGCQTSNDVVDPAPVDFVETSWSLDDYLTMLQSHGIQRSTVADMVPVTAMQNGLLFHARSKPDDLAYLEQVDFCLHDVEAIRLASAFQALPSEFPLLRAAFVVGNNGQTAQLIRHLPKWPIETHDLSALTTDEQQAVIDAARELDQRQPFDIRHAPLMRVQLFILQARGKKSKTSQGGGRVHVLWTHHHLIMDGWCVGILFDRLLSCYAAGAAPVSSIHPMALNQDYFRWLARQDKTAAREYWKTLLQGVESPTRLLPWPQSDNKGSGYQHEQYRVNLPSALVTGLKSLGASENATLSTVIRLVWGVLLARFSSNPDVVFGTVVSGRPAEVAGIDRAVGLFINTVPVRFQLHQTLTASKALQQIQAQANNSRAYEYLSLAEIQEAAPDLRAREALFDHLVVLENYPMDQALRGSGAGAGLGETSVRISDIRAFERTDLPLNLLLVPSADGIEATFSFDASVYPAAQIQHLAEHFVQLAGRLVRSPEQALCTLDLLTPLERDWLFGQWNRRESEYPVQLSVIDLFRQCAVEHSERVALCDDKGDMSYAELWQRVQAVASSLLTQQHCVPGQRIALWQPRNREMVVAMLAVLSTGCSYVALDPVYPQERLRFIVEDSAARCVLCSTDMPVLPVDVACVDIATLGRGDALISLPVIDPAAAAYVIYTSGSTGQPKGCEISHRNLVRLLRNQDFDFDFDHNDVWVVAHSFCFDFSVWEMYGALLNGGKLIIPAVADVRNVETFVGLVVRHKVSVLNQTPAAFYQFVRAALKRPASDLRALRLVVFGGDSLVCSRLAAWVDVFPTSRVKLVNMYGITETTVHVSYREVQESDIRSGSPINYVGRPLPETGVWIVDLFGQLQPPGIAGEIVISGSGVGMGYLNRPELCAQKFPVLGSIGNQRCYRSGDVGYISTEHGLVYLGRNDHQVQIRGFRVECGEIARVLETHQSVREALVVPIENPHGTELVAYLVGDVTAAPAQWRPWLSARLPEYMVPAYTLWLEAMPLTGNGKVDRSVLPDPVGEAQNTSSEVPDATEEKIIQVWRRVLQQEQIGPLTNFFDIGGHSLKALTLADLMQAELDSDISVNDVFEYPTPRQQALLCAERARPNGSLQIGSEELDGLSLDEVEAILADVSGDSQSN